MLDEPKRSEKRTVNRASLPVQVQEILREEIITGVWEPGKRLPEMALCERFGVSRTPLREALKALEAEGLLKLYPSRGAIVTDVTITDMKDKMRILQALETLAVEIACEVATPQEVKSIIAVHEALWETHKRSRKLSDTRDFYLGNFHFHQLLVAASHNDTLIEMHRNLHRHVQRIRHLVGLFDETDEGMVEHERIVTALKKRDSESARSATSEHMQSVAKRMIDTMREQHTD